MQHQAIVHDIAVRTVSFPFDTIDRDVIGLVVPPRYRLTDATLEFFPNLRYVGVPSVGTDHVLALGASAPQVRIVNAPGFNTEEVAEHTVAFILMLLRGYPGHSASWRRGAGTLELPMHGDGTTQSWDSSVSGQSPVESVRFACRWGCACSSGIAHRWI